MSTSNKVSIKRIIGNVIGNLRLKNVSAYIDDFARWAFEAEMKIGSKSSYRHFECELTIKNRVAKLPPNFIYLEALKIGNRYLNVTHKNFRMFANSDTSNNLSNRNAVNIDTGVTAQARADGSGFNIDLDFTASVFSITNGQINFNIENDTKIGISYMGMDLDDEGYPLVSRIHEDAVTAYLMWMFKAGEYYEGKLPQHIYKELEQRWYWLCGQARGEDELPNEEELKYLGNIWNQLLPIANKNFF